MSSKYFKNFPLIEYNGTAVRNILLKTSILNEVFFDETNFYDYLVEDGEKAVHVAFNYYDSVDYVWLVYLSNKIKDPYFDWHLSNEEFEAFLAKKYGSVTEALQEVVEWNLVVDGEIVSTVSPRTKQYYDEEAQLPEEFVFQAVYAYDVEFSKNEAKRRIKLIDKRYAARISNELEKALSQ
jgi:hypothetical protein